MSPPWDADVGPRRWTPTLDAPTLEVIVMLKADCCSVRRVEAKAVARWDKVMVESMARRGRQARQSILHITRSVFILTFHQIGGEWLSLFILDRQAK